MERWLMAFLLLVLLIFTPTARADYNPIDPRARTWTLLNSTDSVNVGNFPDTQAVTGTFWQATQPVSGTFWQATQPVSASSLPLPSGAASESTLSTVSGKLPALGQAAMSGSQPVVLASNQMTTSISTRATSALPVRATPLNLWRMTFSKVLASNVDPTLFSTISTGAGQTVSQSAGNLVLTSGTTANSETILRSLVSFKDSLILKYQMALSQRIVNNNFVIELVDIIGDALALTVNSATSITITIPSNPFTSEHVGSSMYIGAISGVTGAVPGRYAIASVSGNNVTFTVAGWPGSGSGTASVFGYNYQQVIYNGTNATSASYDTQRNGWNFGPTAPTTLTSASPGHMGIISQEDGVGYFLDQLVASLLPSTATVEATTRASRVTNMPDESVALYVQIRSLNGTTNPATTTTATIGMLSVENYAPQAVTIHTSKAQGIGQAMPVQISNTPSIGTVSTVTTVGTVTSSNTASPTNNADVASAALTTTTTTVALQPSFGSAHKVSIPVTAVSGTNPTLDVQIQESSDTGINWYPVYDFPRITATGFYHSPTIPLTGNRVRYVQTVGGTTPSFTRAIYRLQSSLPSADRVRQQFDRTINLASLNSTTPALFIGGTTNVQLVVAIGAATGAPALQLEGSDDNANWYALGSPLTAVASSTVQTTVNNVQATWLRARVSTAGTGVTPNFVSTKAF